MVLVSGTGVAKVVYTYVTTAKATSILYVCSFCSFYYSPCDTIALVMNVEVEVVSDTSVRVSWDSVDIPEITGYTVYYNQTGNRKRQSEESITVPSSDNSVVIEGLLNNVEYQFQVVAIAELDGDVIMGQRSNNMTIIVVAIPTS